jgi:hypothetical protein
VLKAREQAAHAGADCLICLKKRQHCLHFRTTLDALQQRL